MLEINDNIFVSDEKIKEKFYKDQREILQFIDKYSGITNILKNAK
jgi:hypothetical protein